MERKTICFATNNSHKLEEVKAICPPHIEIISLREAGCTEDLPETQKTIEGNALQKALYVREKFGIDCFSDDTGLEVEVLGGEPGVDTAHYAGPERDAIRNMSLLLKNLEGKPNRNAHFKTIIACVWQGEIYTFEGKVEGKIAMEPTGNQGFGYDPVFIPNGFEHTFAELGPEVKNQFSHRALVVRQLIYFLNSVV